MATESKVDDKEFKGILEKMLDDFQQGPIGAKAGYYSADKGEIIDPDEKNPPDIADIAKWQEFGTYNIPPRPFIRNAQDKANKRCENAVKALMDDGTDMETICKMLANMLVEEIKRSIRNGNWTANAPITIDGGWMHNKKSGKLFYVKGKKSTKPLIDTGNLIQSVHCAVVKRNGSEIIQE